MKKSLYSQVHITIPINVINLADISNEVAAELFVNPYKIEGLFNNTVSTIFSSLGNSVQIELKLLISSLPALPQVTASSLYNETRALFQFQAVVKALSSVIKYVKSRVFSCVQCNQDYIIKYNKDETTSQKQNNSLLCKHCGSPMLEDASLRQSGDKVLIKVIPYITFSLGKNRHRYQAATLSVNDELCYGLELGIPYNIVLSHDLRVWGYEPLLPHPIRSLPFFPTSINEFIKFIRVQFHESPLALVTALSLQLGQGIYPHAAFLQLKSALLLSIASLSIQEAGISILALGDISRLMISAIETCPRMVNNVGCIPHSTTFMENPYNWREAGSLLLSSQAVLYIGDISCISSSNISKILKAVDSEVISQAGKDEQVKTPLKAAVWAHWNCDGHSFQDIKQLKTLINIFGVPFMGKSNIKEEDLAEYILMKSVKPIEKFDSLLPIKDLTMFLELISAQKVEMSPMASSLIRNYFVASRQVRPCSLPIRSINIMTRMAESCARLNLRRTVLHEDALLAAFLYEESLATLFGQSMYSCPLDRGLSGTDRIIDIVKKTDETLMKFSLWVDQYTKALCTSSITTSQLKLDD